MGYGGEWLRAREPSLGAGDHANDGRCALVGVIMLVILASGIPAHAAGGSDSNQNRDQNRDRNGEPNVNATIALSDLNHVCPLDCISSIENPTFVSPDESSAHTTERVIGISVNGEARAYPLSEFREVVNDTIAGMPVLVTWCPLCGTPIAFERRVDGEEVEFGVSGKLHHNDLVLYDRESFTLWQQISGEAIVGPGVPGQLRMISASLVSLGDWVERHPETVVLAGGTVTRSSGRMLPYEEELHREAAGDRDQESYSNARPDTRLDGYQVVHGVEVDGDAKAYPVDSVRGVGTMQDTVAGRSILIVAPDGTNFVHAFRSPSSSEISSRNISLTSGEITDNTGRRWALDGAALSTETQDLQELPVIRSYWFAWSAFHPNSELYHDGT